MSNSCASLPRTIFDAPDDSVSRKFDSRQEPLVCHPCTSAASSTCTRKFYDQIAWFAGEQGTRRTSFSYRSAGTFDFRGVVMKRMETEDLSWRLSDHLPLWVEMGDGLLS